MEETPRKKKLTESEAKVRQQASKRKSKLKRKIAKVKKKPEKADAWSDVTFLGGTEKEEIAKQIIFERTNPIAKMFASQFPPPKRKKKKGKKKHV